MNDLRFAFRQLLKNPGFTVVAGLTLALGIGATTAIFSIVNAVLLRPLPYLDSGRLVRLHEAIPTRGLAKVPVSVRNYLDWKAQSTVFADLAAHGWEDFNLTGLGEARRLKGARVTANLFSVLGVNPELGRAFTAEEETRGKHFVALISHELWQRDFAGSPTALGRSLTLGGEAFTIVGVLPRGLGYPGRRLDLWVPAAFNADELKYRHSHSWGVVARLKHGVTVAQAAAELKGIAARIAQEDEESRDFSASVNRLQDDMVGDLRTPLFLLLGAVGCVLAIACANVANLSLARASARAKEFAIRSALGAGRKVLIRQLLSESVVLALLGGGAGVLLAVWGVSLFSSIPGLRLPRADEIRVSLPVLLFALGVTLGTGVLFGLVPALRAAGSDANDVLKDGGRTGSEGLGRNRYRAGLVVLEMALSLILLAGGGLLLRSFAKLQAVNPGFRAAGLLTANVLLPDKQYPTEQRQAAAVTEMVARLRVIPGAERAAAVFGLPHGGMRSQVTFALEGRPRFGPDEPASASYRQVTPDYFATLEIPLLRGRDFNAFDTTNSAPVVIVNEAFQRIFFPHVSRGSIPGTRINISGGSNDWATVVGVVGDVRSEQLAKPPEPELFLPMTQRCWGYATLVVRTSLDPAALAKPLRAAVAAVDSDLPLDSVRPMQSLLDDHLADRRLQAWLLGAFALLALVLAATGIYGVMAYSVSRRVQEIGIRMALGARLGDVLCLIVRQGMALASVGIVLGLAGGLGVARLLAGLLYEIQPHDPPTFGAVTVLLATVALLACWLPARRAARVDPMVALRGD